MLTDRLLTSIVGSAITDTNTVQLVPYASSISNHFLSELDIRNSHASVDTAIDIMAGEELLWTMPAPAGKSKCRKFDPPLKLPSGSNLSIKARDASSIEAAVRYLRGIVDPVQPAPPAFSFTRRDMSSAGLYYGEGDNSNDYVLLGDNWTLGINDSWTVAFQLKYNGGSGNETLFSSQDNTSYTGISITSYSSSTRVTLFNKDGANHYLEVRTNGNLTPYDSWTTIVVDYDGSRTSAGIRVWQDGVLLTNTEQNNTLTANAAVVNNSTTVNGSKSPSGYADILVWMGGATQDTIDAYNDATEVTEEPDWMIEMDDESGTIVTATKGTDGSLLGDDGSNWWVQTS